MGHGASVPASDSRGLALPPRLLLWLRYGLSPGKRTLRLGPQSRTFRSSLGSSRRIRALEGVLLSRLVAVRASWHEAAVSLVCACFPFHVLP